MFFTKKLLIFMILFCLAGCSTFNREPIGIVTSTMTNEVILDDQFAQGTSEVGNVLVSPMGGAYMGHRINL